MAARTLRLLPESSLLILGNDHLEIRLLAQIIFPVHTQAVHTTRAWFDEAKSYQVVRQTRVPLKLPKVGYRGDISILMRTNGLVTLS